MVIADTIDQCLGSRSEYSVLADRVNIGSRLGRYESNALKWSKMQPRCEPVNPTYPALVAVASSQKLGSLQCSGMVWFEMAGEVFGFDKTFNNSLSLAFTTHWSLTSTTCLSMTSCCYWNNAVKVHAINFSTALGREGGSPLIILTRNLVHDNQAIINASNPRNPVKTWANTLLSWICWNRVASNSNVHQHFFLRAPQ